MTEFSPPFKRTAGLSSLQHETSTHSTDKNTKRKPDISGKQKSNVLQEKVNKTSSSDASLNQNSGERKFHFEKGE